MTNGPEDESGKTMMFDPSQAEDFRRKMAEEVEALKRGKMAPPPPPEPEDEATAKTMMFSPGQLEAQLRAQQQPVSPPPAAPSVAHPVVPPAARPVVPPVARPVAPPPAPSQAPPDDGSGAVTQMFSAADVAKQMDEVKRMRDQGISGLPPMPKPLMPTPRAPVAPPPPVAPAPSAPVPQASQTVAYAPDQVKDLLAKAKSGGDDDLGTAQTMMYSVEQSAQLREAMALMEEHKAQQASDPLADAHELLRQAREADEAAAAGPANPFSQYAPAPDANPFAQGPGAFGGHQPPSTGGFAPPSGGFQPGGFRPGGFQPGAVPQGVGQGYPPPGFQGGRPVMDEGDLDDVQPSKGKGLKIALIVAGVVGAVVLALVLLNGFDVIDIPVLPKF